MKPLVQLCESAGLGLIIAYPSGIIYSNQTGCMAAIKKGEAQWCSPLIMMRRLWTRIGALITWLPKAERNRCYLDMRTPLVGRLHPACMHAADRPYLQCRRTLAGIG